jgi:2-phospho-L-lactate guanylyltransferase
MDIPRQAESPPGLRKPVEAILIPVKGLAESKLRLAGVLGPPQRGRLALSMLADVLLAAAGWPLRMLVTSDPAAASLARSAGWSIVADPGSGLNDAVAVGTASATSAGATALLVLPCDVPLVTRRELEAVFATDADVVVARSDDGGTNGLLRRPPGAITARFGPNSADAHAGAAGTARLRVASLRLPGLVLDVDDADDLRCLAGSSLDHASVRLARELLAASV